MIGATALVVDSQAKAAAFSAAIDARNGYPRNATDIGGGIHAPPAESQAVHYGTVTQHPTLPVWAYWPYDATAGPLAIPVGGTTQALDATWSTAPVVASVGVAVVDTP